jgi:ParB-like chromosome segregation protein Spo0J
VYIQQLLSVANGQSDDVIAVKKEVFVEIKPVCVDELKPWDKNPRVNDTAVDAVAKSIETFGFNVPILYDQQMTIVAGHVRWKAAKRLGLKTVPGIQLSLTRAQREAFAVADNKTADIADWDYDILEDILKDLPEEGVDLSSLGFSKAELEAILEPAEDFNWDEFKEDLEECQQDATHVFLPVKVPIDMKQSVREAIRQCARERAIAENDNARLAGLVVMSLLGMSLCKSRWPRKFRRR